MDKQIHGAAGSKRKFVDSIIGFTHFGLKMIKKVEKSSGRGLSGEQKKPFVHIE